MMPRPDENALPLATGRPIPLGADWDGRGVNFAIYSDHADRVELCLFAERGTSETARIPLERGVDGVWHVYVAGLAPGCRYGYRIDGPYDPAAGHRFNANKLLIDPYARAIGGPLVWHPEHDGISGYDPHAADPRDSAKSIPPCIVIDPSFDWGDDVSPETPWERTVIYECHVKGMTALHPAVEPEQRGGYLGLASEPVLEHLCSLGVTAVELLPVHHAYIEEHLVRRGLTNYWGYAPIGFFAPDPRFARSSSGQQVSEFKEMVRRFHAAGIEVILDVVYNHTGEGNQSGATVSLRGIDNSVYYRTLPGSPDRYVDYTGCGNSLNVDHPQVLRLIMDSLRYWAGEMRVDGFRFDLATTMTRDGGEPSPNGRFVSAILQDPLLHRKKLIAEPWDLGPYGNLEGAFPRGWAEWNAKYRDHARQFWRGDPGLIGDCATRLAGSSDLLAASGRGPASGINFITCHDGHTLRDLVSYEDKHNHANGEDNQDGHDHGFGSNWGTEGPTADRSIRATRLSVMRALLATLAFSQGVPMLLHGDEIGRTQRGNNNAYAQDNELSWVDWQMDAEAQTMLEWTRRILTLRRDHPVLRRRSFFSGGPIDDPGSGSKPVARDLVWLRSDGNEMTHDDWHDPELRALGMFMHADGRDALADLDEEVETLVVLLNAGENALDFPLPAHHRLGLEDPAGRWAILADSSDPAAPERTVDIPVIAAHAVVLLAWRSERA